MEYKCIKCNKYYSSYQSLWIHNKKFHSQSKPKLTKTGEIKKINDKYNCQQCKENFNNINDLDSHIKLKCKPNIKHDNVFKFNTNTFGKNKYPNDKGGDIYIIQTEFSLKNYYKIGITTNLYHRMSSYRCGAVIEPRIHCYFPIKNIKESDILMKKKLLKYNIKREIYKIDNLIEVTKILKELQKEMNSEKLEVLPEIKKCDICKCNYCNKIYTSYYELNIHLQECEEYITHIGNINELRCRHCNKVFTRKDNLSRHYNNCKETKEIKLETENKSLKEKINELKEKDKFFNNFKKQIMDLMNNNAIIQYDSNCCEKINILDHVYLCLKNLIENATFNYNTFHFENIIIINLQNNIAYKYNLTTNIFDMVIRKESLEGIIMERIYDRDGFFNNHKNDISSKMQNVIETFIKKMDTESYEDTKKNNIKIILYNNRRKVKMATPQLDQEEELIV